MSGLLIDERGGATWIRLNRPEIRNAFDAELLGELTDVVRTAESGVVVITGSGGSFCAGGYLRDLETADPRRLRDLFYGTVRLVDEIRNQPAPVIAAVNGFAIGGGNELVIACDLAVAGESAVFGQTGVSIGSAPVLGGTNMLTALIGEKRAKEVAFMCRRYTAREALGLGWINAVVPDANLEAEVDAWTRELLTKSRRYLEIAKISSNAWWNLMRESYLSGLGMLVQAIGSEDMLEGTRAFAEKRAPDFPTRH